jgi:hypothetical protein
MFLPNEQRARLQRVLDGNPAGARDRVGVVLQAVPDDVFHRRLRNYSSHDRHFVRPSRRDAFFADGAARPLFSLGNGKYIC